jgi:hypothetical protein
MITFFVELQFLGGDHKTGVINISCPINESGPRAKQQLERIFDLSFSFFPVL